MHRRRHRLQVNCGSVCPGQDIATLIMSKHVQDTAILSPEITIPNPIIESNSQSRRSDVLKLHELQEEQFISEPCTPLNVKKVVYGNAVAGNETVREATMTLYNSLNASDHI